jgi:hypothetical protein
VLSVVTGLLAVTGGPAGMLDGQATTSTVDSEVRFLAVYWLAYGVLLLWVVPQVERRTGVVRAALAVMFASGCARALSFLRDGTPHPVMVAAMAVELVLPPVLWYWQAGLARRLVPVSTGPTDDTGMAFELHLRMSGLFGVFGRITGRYLRETNAQADRIIARSAGRPVDEVTAEVVELMLSRGISADPVEVRREVLRTMSRD